MKLSRLALAGAVVLGAVLVIGAIALAAPADTLIRRSVISAGAGTGSSGQTSVRGLFGQAITGLSSESSTQIRGGWWTAGGSGGAREGSFMPLLLHNACVFTGAWECEDNDLPDQANGPLRFGQPLKGSLADANESASDQNTEDWFYFDWAAGGVLSVDVTSFSPVGQVALYHESVGSGDVALAADEPSGDYHLTYDGSAGAGKYLLRLYVPGDKRPAGAPNYTLVVNQ
jgi:hypothetical protein